MDINDFQNLPEDEKQDINQKIARRFAKHIALQTLVPVAMVVVTHLVIKKLEKNDDQD